MFLSIISTLSWHVSNLQVLVTQVCMTADPWHASATRTRCACSSTFPSFARRRTLSASLFPNSPSLSWSSSSIACVTSLTPFNPKPPTRNTVRIIADRPRRPKRGPACMWPFITSKQRASARSILCVAVFDIDLLSLAAARHSGTVPETGEDACRTVGLQTQREAPQNPVRTRFSQERM